MGLTITDRPSETLSNGFLSRWASSELPLQYTIQSDLYPINNQDSPTIISSLYYDSAEAGVIIQLLTSSNTFIPFETITVNNTGTSLDGNNFSIKKVLSNSNIIIDFVTQETSNSGTVIPYYNNYNGLVKVFAGAPDQHVYNVDGSKPMIQVGVIDVDFKNNGTYNIGKANVNAYIKAYLNANFDTDENTHYGWTSFYIEYAESYDVSNGSEVTNYTSPFELDLSADCQPIGYLNPDFDNGLTDWSTFTGVKNNVSYQGEWTSSIDSVSASFQQGNSYSIATPIVYQNITVFAGADYVFNIDVSVSRSCAAVITDSEGNYYSSYSIPSSGSYNIPVTFPKNITGVGISFLGIPFAEYLSVDLSRFEVSSTIAQPCLFTQFANFGTKQFQDNLGGNFGDYVLNTVNTIIPKMLTHFDSKTYFKGKPFYFSAIIPNSTFSLSENSDNLFLDINLFDRAKNSVYSFRYKVDNENDGVYTLDISEEIPNDIDWYNGTAQFTIIPNNSFTDGDNGTFENQSTTGISILFNGIDLQYVGVSINTVPSGYDSDYSCGVQVGAPSMNQTDKIYDVLKNDTQINIFEGREYLIESWLYVYNQSSFEPSQINNGSFFWLPDGYNKTECTVVPYEVVEDNFGVWVKTSTNFRARQDESLTLTFYEEIKEDINYPTGGMVLIDNITFQGPIDYISEVKTVENSCDCDLYGGTLRWLNDLNGWESWYFSKQKTVKENVAKKVDIIKNYRTDWSDDFINGETQNDTIRTHVSKSIVLRSQLLTKNQHQNLQQIKRSARVQVLMDSGKWQTVTIKRSGYEIDDEQEDIFEMALTVELPNILVQGQ